MTSSKVTVVELEGTARADSQVSKITDPEEAGKRRRQSRSKRAKKAAKTKRRDPSPGPSVPPGPDPEDEDDDDVDIHAFEELRGPIPDPDAREAFDEMASLAKGTQGV